MRTGTGLVSEMRVDEHGRVSAWVRCAAELRPAPGQFVLGWDPLELEAALAQPLFAGEYDEQGFLALGAHPTWQPGARLALRGPLGRGFQLPGGVRQVALVAFAGQAGRLMPLAHLALAQGAAVVLYGEPEVGSLPLLLEAFPLAALPEALSWADFIAADAPLAELGCLGALLGRQAEAGRTLTGQVLVDTPMPCAGAADCGLCATSGVNGWKLACKDGPVLDLRALDWRRAAG